MLVMFDVTDPVRVHTTTKGEGKAEVIDLKGLLARDGDFVRAAVEALVQAALEAEMTEAIGAAKGERSETRLSYRSGHYSRSLITRVGSLELRVPRDRMGRFSTELFERYQRSEKGVHAAERRAYGGIAGKLRSEQAELHRSPPPEQFVADSPLEERRFEPSVP